MQLGNVTVPPRWQRGDIPLDSVDTDEIADDAVTDEKIDLADVTGEDFGFTDTAGTFSTHNVGAGLNDLATGTAIKADAIKETHVDWGSGAGQVNDADIPASTTGDGEINAADDTVAKQLARLDNHTHATVNVPAANTSVADSAGLVAGANMEAVVAELAVGAQALGTPYAGYILRKCGGKLAWAQRGRAWVTRATDTTAVACAGYTAINTGAANWGGGTSERHFLCHAHHSRIRQNGSLTKVQLRIASKPAQITAFYIEVWREVTSNSYTRISQEDVWALCSAGATNTITLATPVTVQEGDFIGYGWTCSSGPGNFLVYSTSVAGSTYYVTDEAPGTSGYAWESKTSNTALVPIYGYMVAPRMIGLGDSIMAGHNDHYSFIESTNTTSIATSLPYLVGSPLSWTWQNMGVGGQTTSNIAARIATDCTALKPRCCLVNGGINDIFAAYDAAAKATFLANWTTILNALTAASVVPIVLLMCPRSDSAGHGGTAEMQARDNWNTALAELVGTSYPKALVVDPNPVVGTFRAGGDVGNLWDWATDMNADATHPSAAGYAAIAEQILAQI